MVQLSLSGVVPPWWVLFCFPRFEDTCSRHQCHLVSDSWKSLCGSVFFSFLFFPSSSSFLSAALLPPVDMLWAMSSDLSLQAWLPRNTYERKQGWIWDFPILSPFSYGSAPKLHLSWYLEALTALLSSYSLYLTAEIWTHFDTCSCGEQWHSMFSYLFTQPPEIILSTMLSLAVFGCSHRRVHI